MGIENPICDGFFEHKVLFTAIYILFLAMAPTVGVGSSLQESDTEHSPLASTTYVETVKLLHSWEEGPGDDEQLIAGLFASGDARGSDFESACHNEDRETKEKSYFLLYLLGRSTARECASQLKIEGPPAVLSVSDRVSVEDYAKLEELFRPRDCEKTKNCGGDALPLVDESLVYALVLDGSARSMELLARMSALAKASHDEDNVVFDIAVRFSALTREANNSAHNLKFDDGAFEGPFKKSIFFVPTDQRENTDIKLLARNGADNRLLVEVSYVCGRLCGSGYYVVLRKNPSGTWDYALIVRAWIS